MPSKFSSVLFRGLLGVRGDVFLFLVRLLRNLVCGRVYNGLVMTKKALLGVLRGVLRVVRQRHVVSVFVGRSLYGAAVRVFPLFRDDKSSRVVDLF